MWSLIQFLVYDLPYFLYKSAEDFKWGAVIIFCVYQIGRISGMRFLKKILEAHFPYFKDETEDFKKWAVKQIVRLGGDPFIPQREYHGAGRLSPWHRKSGTMSANLSQGLLPREGS